MNDRFKFRHWDKQINQMRYGDIQLGSNGKPFILGKNNDNEGMQVYDIENVITMMCTGLKDKNGKIVYFDDLVKNKWGEICKVVKQIDDRNYGRVVLKNIKYLNDACNQDVCFIPSCIKDSEVIGNIYENSELLNADT